MTPQEIKRAFKAQHTTVEVNDDATRMTAILRPENSSRTFVLVAAIESVEEI